MRGPQHQQTAAGACPPPPALVSAQRLETYRLDAVVAALEAALAPLGGMEAFVRPGDRVLLKPNWIAPSAADEAVVTHPAVILGLARLARQAGGQTWVGDSPPLASAWKVAEKSGYFDYAESAECPVIEFDRAISAPAVLDGPARRFVFGVDPAAYDVRINVPKLKVHCQLRMTGAIKNLFGLVKGRGKAWLHFSQSRTDERFWRMLIQCHATARPALHVMDAVVALGRWGPRHGDPHPVGLLLASVDPVALDRVACEAVGIDPARVPLIGMGAAMGLGQGDRAAITVQGADLDALSIAPIVVPDPLIPIRFSLWHNIKGLLRRWRHHGLPCCRARQ